MVREIVRGEQRGAASRAVKWFEKSCHQSAASGRGERRRGPKRGHAAIKPGSHVVMVGAGFIAFTILNSILSLGATLTIVELAPRILPRMIDDTGAKLVEDWLTKHGVTIRTGARLARIEDAKGRKR